jgi:cobalt-precorrin 5A hydrolase
VASGASRSAVGSYQAAGWIMIVIGIGANSRAHESDFPIALAAACAEAGEVDVVTTYDAANFANHVEAAARQVSIAYRPSTLDDMRERNGDCLVRSERAMALLGVASVAEAAALVGAGPGSRLIIPRRIIGNITIAAAQSADGKERSE